MAVALWVANESDEITGTDEFLAQLDAVTAEVAATRPTAVNLAWGAERMRSLAHENSGMALPELRELLVNEALAMSEEDEARNRRIGEFGAALLPKEARVLTHCNAGSLATAFFGTALGVIFTAHEQGKIGGVWVDETRPVLQGSRLTAWELRMAGVPFRLITDSMAASIMRAGWVDAVIVGADRIAANGDTANKIGTYGLAVLCKEHGVPFYVAAPTSTVDLTLPNGDDIVIEERDPREVTGISFSGVLEPSTPTETAALDSLTREGTWVVPIGKGHAMEVTRKGGAYQLDGWARIAPPGVDVYNPAFDVTPAALITAIITENGVVLPDFEASLADACEGSGALHELG
jgi:methylthioribose-1-phosphate isomerase